MGVRPFTLAVVAKKIAYQESSQQKGMKARFISENGSFEGRIKK